MKGLPCHFELKADATPVSMRGSRQVAAPLMQRLKDELELQGIIRKVTVPTALVQPNGRSAQKVRRDPDPVNFRFLNDNIIRPRFESLTPFQAVRTIPKGMRFFTVVDELKGYHQVPLDDESSALTTLSTPFGRFQYVRLPMGVTHAGDDFGRRVSDVFDDIPNACQHLGNFSHFISSALVLLSPFF